MECHDLSEQIDEYLLRGINPNRIKQRSGGGGKQLSYLEGWEVRAHLTRVFGFGNWNVTTKAEVLYADVRPDKDGKDQWHVGAKADVDLNIVNDGAWVHYSDVAASEAVNPNRGEATDQALKTAATDGLKRAAVNLGDQFGLSLYRNGSTAPVVQTLTPWAAGPVTDKFRTVRDYNPAPEPAEAAEDARLDAEGEALSAEEALQAAQAMLQHNLGAEVVGSGAFDGGDEGVGESQDGR